jgi:hypothetical protein
MKMRFPIKTASLIKPEKQLFFGVFFFGFILQVVARTARIGNVDRLMWADEIKFFLSQDPRVFNFHAAYGQPGTTLVGLGSLFHVFFGIPYVAALDLSVSLLIAAATAACSVLCFMLNPNSKWWLATTFVLLLNRMYLKSTPPTAVEMPFIALIVLSSWWLWEQQSMSTKWISFFLIGVIVGLAASTRLDATLLVSPPLLFLLLHRHGRKVVLPFFLGSGISFFVSDPFLWFMPMQHLFDIVHKFIIHYTNSKEIILPTTLDPIFWINYTWLSVLSLGWALVLLCQRRLGQITPAPLMLVFIGISLFAIIGILTSKFQSVHYLFPLIIVWEVFLPLFALETLVTSSRQYAIPELIPHISSISRAIIVFSALLQLLAYLPLI